MDALHPRLLPTDFPAAYAFYSELLPKTAVLSAGGPQGPYASWDVNGEGILSMLDRSAAAHIAGTGDGLMFVCRVDDVDAAADTAVQNGATLVAPPTNRPEWGPTLRTAHVRDPEGTLIELQSY